MSEELQYERTKILSFIKNKSIIGLINQTLKCLSLKKKDKLNEEVQNINAFDQINLSAFSQNQELYKSIFFNK